MDEVESYYNEKSSMYDSVFDIAYFRIYDAITWKYLEPYIPTGPGALVLDAGGGTGRWSVRMATKGCKVILVDNSSGMLKLATERVEKAGLVDRVTVEKGDLRKLKHKDETFDMAFCEHTLFALEDPDVVIREFSRVLRKGAPLVISAQNLYVQLLMHLPFREIPQLSKFDEVTDLLFRRKHDTMTKDGKVEIHTWTPDEFRSMLERNGFEVQKIVGKGVTIPLRMAEELYSRKDCPESLLEKILQLEFALCERSDALALAGHMQAIARKVT
jgi:ubiquinone/menaquinone biosynthesis C-methylase UbiE